MARRPTAAHLPLLTALHQDAAVMATLGGVRTPESSRAYLADNLAHWEAHGFGLWLLFDRDGGFAGRGGIRRRPLDGTGEVEVAYALRPPYWGRGLATEFPRACVRHGFGPLGLPDLVAFTTPDNLASRRVMEKAGFGDEKAFAYNGHGSVLYRIGNPAAKRR